MIWYAIYFGMCITTTLVFLVFDRDAVVYDRETCNYRVSPLVLGMGIIWPISIFGVIWTIFAIVGKWMVKLNLPHRERMRVKERQNSED
jgi:uncharacterized membrane protein